MENVDIIKTILLVAVGVYEVIARIVPSVNDWTVVGNIFKFLKWISDYFNSAKSDIKKVNFKNQ